MTLSTCHNRAKSPPCPTPNDKTLTYVITEPCVNTKDTACVDVCPVECIYESEPNPGTLSLPMFIHPDECIDCGACEPECPVDAIYPEEDVPDNWTPFIQANTDLASEADM
jgi:ferredoxin